jgi:hypothetical protein
MHTIIKHIPRTIIIEDLESLFQPYLKGGLFSKDIDLKAIKLVKRIDKSGNAIERHALVSVCSDLMQKRLTQSINSNRFKDSLSLITFDDAYNIDKLSAVEFLIRCYSNDRRGASLFIAKKGKEAQISEKRTEERRRLDLTMQCFSEKRYGTIQPHNSSTQRRGEVA